MNKPDVSIVIRTLNEQRYLGDLLQGIKDQQTKRTQTDAKILQRLSAKKIGPA